MFFFFTTPATTEFYTLSLHDALPISLRYSSSQLRASRSRWLVGSSSSSRFGCPSSSFASAMRICQPPENVSVRSEEHTSELQSRRDLVCRLLLEKKKKKKVRCEI